MQRRDLLDRILLSRCRVVGKLAFPGIDGRAHHEPSPSQRPETLVSVVLIAPTFLLTGFDLCKPISKSEVKMIRDLKGLHN